MNVNEVAVILSLACAERSRSEGCDWGEDMKKRITIIGSGPSAFLLAAFLDPKKYTITIYEKNKTIQTDYTIFALGGGSWKVTGSDGNWLDTFSKKGIQTKSFQASKSFPLEVVNTAFVDEAISTVGGIDLKAVSENFELKKMSNRFCIGEMLDWDDLTGGYLLQACRSTGVYLANHLNKIDYHRFN